MKLTKKLRGSFWKVGNFSQKSLTGKKTSNLPLTQITAKFERDNTFNQFAIL